MSWPTASGGITIGVTAGGIPNASSMKKATGSMTPRSLETLIARFTLVLLLVYAPLETWASWPALSNPFYLVDVVGFVLLLWGATTSLRARPAAAPGVLCAGYAWSAANGWRALAIHIGTLEQGGQVDAGLVWLLAMLEVAALVGLALLLLLVVESRPPPEDRRRESDTDR